MGELEEKVNEAIRVAFDLALVTACCAVCMYVGYRHLEMTGALPKISFFNNGKKEMAIEYESEKVRKLAGAVRAKYPCPERLLDRNKDGKITEEEVLFYLRNQ
ncbi:MAG: hypothetical protein QXR48_00485 [Candidatus Woesearchaeota archaeon]